MDKPANTTNWKPDTVTQEPLIKLFLIKADPWGYFVWERFTVTVFFNGIDDIVLIERITMVRTFVKSRSVKHIEHHDDKPLDTDKTWDKHVVEGIVRHGDNNKWAKYPL